MEPGTCGARTTAHGVRSAARRLAVAGPRGRGGCGEIGAHQWPSRLQRAVDRLMSWSRKL